MGKYDSTGMLSVEQPCNNDQMKNGKAMQDRQPSMLSPEEVNKRTQKDGTSVSLRTETLQVVRRYPIPIVVAIWHDNKSLSIATPVYPMLHIMDHGT